MAHRQHGLAKTLQRGISSVADRGRRDESAEFFVVDQLFDGRMIAAQRAIRIAPDAYFAETHGQRIVHQQATNERFTLADDEFDRFGRLHHTNDPG